MREINKVVVHCSATPPEMDIGVKEIRQWHLERGWKDIGYHYVIRRDGTLEVGRPIELPGAHVRGHNKNSVGICLVGGTDSLLNSEMNFTFNQFDTLRDIYVMTGNVSDLVPIDLGELPWTGHRDFDEGKDCPCFDVSRFIKDGTIMSTVS